jgi:hypothetical protein
MVKKMQHHSTSSHHSQSHPPAPPPHQSSHQQQQQQQQHHHHNQHQDQASYISGANTQSMGLFHAASQRNAEQHQKYASRGSLLLSTRRFLFNQVVVSESVLFATFSIYLFF